MGKKKLLAIALAATAASIQLRFKPLEPLLERDVVCAAYKNKAFCVAPPGASKEERRAAEIFKREVQKVNLPWPVVASISDKQVTIDGGYRGKLHLWGLYESGRISVFSAGRDAVNETIRHELVHAYFDALDEEMQLAMVRDIRRVFKPFIMGVPTSIGMLNYEQWQNFLSKVTETVEENHYNIENIDALIKALNFVRKYSSLLESADNIVTTHGATEIIASMAGYREIQPAFVGLYGNFLDEKYLEGLIDQNGITEDELRQIEALDKHLVFELVEKTLEKIR